MGVLGKLWKKFKGVEEYEDISPSPSAGAGIVTGKSNVTRTVVKVTTHGSILGGEKANSFITTTTDKHPATAADFSMLLDVFRSAFNGAKLDNSTRAAIEGNLQALKDEAGKSTPSRSMIEEKLKDTEAVVRSAGAEANFAQLLGVLRQLAQYLFR